MVMQIIHDFFEIIGFLSMVMDKIMDRHSWTIDEILQNMDSNGTTHSREIHVSWMNHGWQSTRGQHGLSDTRQKARWVAFQENVFQSR